MDGDFKGDFTRDTFSPIKHFSRVLMQQGRVQLDADWNEQGDILTHYLRKLACAIIGPYGGPADGFKITKTDARTQNSADQGDFFIGMGDYYVDGILVENNGLDQDGILVKGHNPYEDSPPLPLYTYLNQPYYPNDPNLTKPPLDTAGPYLVYLDVWEQQITFLEDSSIREVALGASQPDTATRAQIVWQVRQTTLPDLSKIVELFAHSTTDATEKEKEKEKVAKISKLSELSDHLKELLQPTNRGRLKARAKVTQDNTDACTISPDSRYRGDENQLYRVEIHQGGQAEKETGTTQKEATCKGATFKWSRDNGSVVFPILAIAASEGEDTITTVTIGNVGHDDYLSITQGDWVEIVDEDYLLNRIAAPLLKVNKVDQSDPLNILVTLDRQWIYPVDKNKHNRLVLRRWDQRPRASKKDGELDRFDSASGTVKIEEGAGECEDIVIKENWITLEDGIQIQFQASGTKQPNRYRTGDYWLIPARTATGDVEWPRYKNNPDQHVALPPHGVEHHYAPLAIIQYSEDKKVGTITDLRFVFTAQAGPKPQ